MSKQTKRKPVPRVPRKTPATPAVVEEPLEDAVVTSEMDADGADEIVEKAGLEAKKEDGRTGFAHKLYTGELSYEFVGRRKLWYIISAVLLGIAILALLFRGLALGIEFKGGNDFRAPVKVTSTIVPEVRAAVEAAGVPNLGDVTVTTIGDNTVRVETSSISGEDVTKVRNAIAAKVGVSSETVSSSEIGATWGKQITSQAVTALVVFLALVMLMIWMYFREWKMSVSAIIALMHDLVLTVGLYALVGFQVTPATVIGVLTILGYSLYDTVVVFDKVKENTRDLERHGLTYSQAANKAVNQVLVRSINTTIIGVLPVAALLIAGVFILGSGPLEDLGLALFIGMLVGAYSSVFIATPLLCQLKEAEPEQKELRERLERRQQRSGTRRRPTTTLTTTKA